MAARQANPVEVALLFGALGYKVIKAHSARIVLISAPADLPEQSNIIFVAWESGGRLRAFDVTLPPGEVALAAMQTTARMSSRLETIQANLNLQSSTGVFIDEQHRRLVALDLGQTINHHNLQAGLP